VLERRPGTARATQALGLIELRDERLDAALPLLARAAAEGPDDGQVQGAFGRGLISRLSELESSSEEYAATLKRARTVLARAVELDPNGARSLALSGFAELAAGQDLARAETLLTRALTLAPSREEYRLLLAQVLMRRADFNRATEILGRMAASGSSATVRQQAREQLGVMAQLREVERAGALRPAAPPPVPESTPAAPGAPPLPAAPAAGTTDARRPMVIPALRPVGPGETRVLGTFRGIVCGRELTVLSIQTEGRQLQLRQNPSRPPEFIAYVPNPPASVGCGPVNPPQRVLATYTTAARPSTAYDGDVVAIELIPDDFTPP